MTAGRRRGGRGLKIEGKGESPKDRDQEVTLCQKKKNVEERTMPILGWRMRAVEDGGWQDRKRFHSFPSCLH